MALIRLDHLPKTTKVTQPLYVILPDPDRMNGVPVRRRKLLYLLHGLSDDGSAWQRYTSIENLATLYGLVVVMPTVARSFYTDLPNGQQYFTYLAEELPQYLDDVFGLRPAREDTLLAGLSMGGYGAYKLAFHQPERFAAVASFSGVLSLEFMRLYPNDKRFAEFRHVFGDLSLLTGSAHDPLTWFSAAAQDVSRLPRLFFSCGRQDDLYPVNQLVRAQFQQLGIPFEYYEEDDARHDWFFWETEVRRFLDAVLGPVPRDGEEDE